jgi:plastocyanin
VVFRYAAVMLVGGAALLGCSSDRDGRSIAAAASEFEFVPDAWTVPAGEEFTIDFENRGALAHEWVVMKLGDEIESEAEFEEAKVLLEVEAVPAGESTTEAFTIDDAGTYQVICAVETHFDAGMEGSLTVE